MATYQRNADAMETQGVQSHAERIARHLHAAAPNLSAAEKQFLQDVARGRYTFRALDRLATIARQCPSAEDRDALAEAIHAACLPADMPRDLSACFDSETEIQARTDVDQRRFERRPNRATKERLVEDFTAQLAATRAALDAVEALAV